MRSNARLRKSSTPKDIQFVRIGTDKDGHVVPLWTKRDHFIHPKGVSQLSYIWVINPEVRTISTRRIIFHENKPFN